MRSSRRSARFAVLKGMLVNARPSCAFGLYAPGRRAGAEDARTLLDMRYALLGGVRSSVHASCQPGTCSLVRLLNVLLSCARLGGALLLRTRLCFLVWEELVLKGTRPLVHASQHPEAYFSVRASYIASRLACWVQMSDAHISAGYFIFRCLQMCQKLYAGEQNISDLLFLFSLFCT